MAYIDKELVRQLKTACIVRYPLSYVDGIFAFAREIEDIPTADVVEVKCRCADCKHYQRYGRTSLVFEGKNVQAGWCMLRAKTDEEHRMLPFDFCSYGERKETDG